MSSIAPQEQAETLFPDYAPEVRVPAPSEDPSLSADRRRTLRQAEAIAVGRHPLTGGPLHPLASRHRDASSPKSDPFTCGSCYFRAVLGYHNGSYPKCLFEPRRGGDEPVTNYSRVSHSAGTDVRAWWPACTDYSPGSSISPDAARSIPEDDA